MTVRQTAAERARRSGQRPQDIPKPPPFTAAIPLPPSLNNAYPSGKTRRYKSPELVAFKHEAIPLLRQAANAANFAPPPGASLRLVLRLWFATGQSYGASDASNRIKAAEDALAEALGFNDRCVTDVRAIKCGVDRAAPRCEIELTILDAAS
jgi:Holliday junction resolvase RusA-like endonuclease